MNTRVGFIGLGKMGLPMSRRLLANGFPLTVHNRSRGKVDMLAQEGASPASSVKEVVETSDIVLACLPDGPTVESVFLGEDGVVESARRGQVLVDHSTVSSQISKRIGEAAAQKGAAFMDAPISGGVERAAEGTLTIMAGGDEEAFETIAAGLPGDGRQCPARRAYRRRQHCEAGEPTLGSRAFTGRRRSPSGRGVPGSGPRPADRNTFFTSWGASFMLERNGPSMLDRDFENARAPLRLIYKDLAFALEGAKQSGAAMPLAERTMEIILEAEQNGMLDLDVSCLTLPLEKRSGTATPTLNFLTLDLAVGIPTFSTQEKQAQVMHICMKTPPAFCYTSR